MLDTLKKFNMLYCKTVSTPINTSEKFCIHMALKIDERFFRRIVGSLMYLKHTRPEIIFSVITISRFMHCPSSHHCRAAKRILVYIVAKLWISEYIIRRFKILTLLDI